MVKETKFYDALGVSDSSSEKAFQPANEGQVPPDANESQLKSAYKKGALKYHPGTFNLTVQESDEKEG